MITHTDKTPESRTQHHSPDNFSPAYEGKEPAFSFPDNRPEGIAQRKLKELAGNSLQVQRTVQLQAMADAHTAQFQLLSGAAALPDAPIQRVSTGSLAQPDPREVSAEVPDLPKTLVDRLSNAHGQAKREAALKALLKHLDKQGVVDDLSRIKVEYVHFGHNDYAAYVQSTGGSKARILLKVYSNGYDVPVANLYSMIRHELIHVGQRLKMANAQATQDADPLFYENKTDKGVGETTAATIQLWMHEIQTHCWEITHRTETGITDKYRDDTVNDLLGYVARLTNAISGLPVSTFLYWKAYLEKSVTLLAGAYASHNVAGIQTAEQNLHAAIRGREAGTTIHNGRQGYDAGALCAETQQAVASAEADYMDGYNEYLAGLAAAQKGKTTDYSGQAAHYRAFTQYNNGLARAQSGLPNDHTDQHAYTVAYNEYTAGELRGKSGQRNDHTDKRAYTAGFDTHVPQVVAQPPNKKRKTK